jgi:hypothetical protein
VAGTSRTALLWGLKVRKGMCGDERVAESGWKPIGTHCCGVCNFGINMRSEYLLIARPGVICFQSSLLF